MAAFTYTAPTVGGSSDTWGATLNQNWSNLSTFLGSLDSADLAVLDGLTASTAELNLLDGVTATTAELNVLAGVTATASEINLLDGVNATTAELNYVGGVTSAIQTQLNAKASGTAQSTATWEAGTSTTESVVSPAKVKASILANASGYTQPTSTGDVGTYAFLWEAAANTTAPGTSRAGSGLRYGNAGTSGAYGWTGYGGSAPSGTWRCMGHTSQVNGGPYSNSITRLTLWLRIS